MKRIERTVKIIALFVTLFCTSLPAQTTSWVRYNLAGYDPVRPKKAVVMSTTNLSGAAWQIKDSLNATVAGGTLSTSLAGKGDYMPMAFNHVLEFSALRKIGTYKLTVGNLPVVTFKIKPQPYKELVSQILRTIRVRRSGSPDALDHAVSHLGDSSCAVYKRTVQDASNMGKTNSGSESWKAVSPAKKFNLQGGYYDAGDYIKFTLTTSRLTYMLLRSYETAPELFDGVKKYSTTSWDDLLDETQWGLNYLLKCMPEEGEFIIQTGGSKDHEQNLRLPENDLLNGKRECYSALSKTQMGLAAATLALGAKVFAAKGALAQSELYKAKAIQIYTAAKASTAPNAWWQTTASGGENYYDDNTANDNMELAAIELHNLTNQTSYLTDALGFGQAAGAAYWSAWNSYNLPAHTRVYPKNKNLLSYIKADLNTFQANANLANNVWKVPHESVWGSLYSQISVACSALEYTKASKDSSFLSMCYDVMDYVLGRNPWGIGFVATKDVPNSITSSYAVIYRLQPSKFPSGEIAEGPATASDYAYNSQYFSPAHNPNLWHSQFNTSKFTFFEQPGDYISMETTIGGLGDGFYFFTLASQFFFDPTQVLSLENEEVKEKSTFSVTLEKTAGQTTLLLHREGNDPFDLVIANMQGVKMVSFKEVTQNSVVLANNWSEGVYIVTLSSKEGKRSAKFLVTGAD